MKEKTEVDENKSPFAALAVARRAAPWCLEFSTVVVKTKCIA